MAGKKGMKGGGGPRANSGGARPGAGRKPAAKKPLPELKTTDGEFKCDDRAPPAVAMTRTRDPLEFLLDVMDNPEADGKLRVDAAKAALPYIKKRVGEVGKKMERQEAAAKVGSGKFAPSAPPKLVVNNK